jgi:methionyl-tRNA formyltransferase
MSADRIVMCGVTEAGWHLVRDLIRRGVRFSHFVSLSPEQAERHKVAGYRDFSGLAADHGIPLYVPETYSLRSERDQAFFREHRFDLLVQGVWQRLFPREVLETLRVGAVGVHGSADWLPKGRGRSPLNWSLIEGRSRFIMQLFLIRPGVDDGPVFDAEQFDITPFDTIRTLYHKNTIVTRQMLLRSIPRLLDGSITAREQRGSPSHYPRRTAEDGRIDWEEMDVWQVYNFVRAQTRPFPGAFGDLRGTPCRIWRARVFDTRITYPDAEYGEVVEDFDGDLVVNCRGGLLLVDEYEVMR